VSGSGTSQAVCKSAPLSREITMPAPHYSGFYRPDALPATQPTASKHWFYFPSRTQNMLFRWRFPKPIFWLGMEKITPNVTKANALQHKINTKTKARFSRLLRHPVWKQRASILKRNNKQRETSKEKVKKKRISGEADDINKQTYIATK